MKHLRSIFIISLISLSIISAAVYTVFSRERTEEKCILFLSGFGWEIGSDQPVKENVNIPAVFDEVYKSYNRIQLEAGLDLAPYAGKSGMRYTFLVTNYPADTGEPVYADVIVIDGEPVAGDIMTVSISGFMHSLTKNAPSPTDTSSDINR